MDENFECAFHLNFISDEYQVYIPIKSLEENLRNTERVVQSTELTTL